MMEVDRRKPKRIKAKGHKKAEESGGNGKKWREWKVME